MTIPSRGDLTICPSAQMNSSCGFSRKKLFLGALKTGLTLAATILEPVSTNRDKPEKERH